MRNYIGYIIDYSDGKLTERRRKWFENELNRNDSLYETYELFSRIKKTMRAKFDIEEVMSDPDLITAQITASQIVSDLKSNTISYKNNKDFITNSLTSNQNKQDSEEDQTYQDVDVITKVWVEEWAKTDHSNDPKYSERKEFITSALYEEPKQERASIRKIAVRITGLAAAAIIATIFIVKSVSTAYTPESLFQEYYKPLDAFTTTTRGNTNSSDYFTMGIELYGKGNYKEANNIFLELSTIEPNNSKYIFFKGITYLQLGDVEKAITSLNDVVSKQQDFSKDAKWYLGLAYLKIGSKDKALTQFKQLATVKGYYQESAQRILEILK